MLTSSAVCPNSVLAPVATTSPVTSPFLTMELSKIYVLVHGARTSLAEIPEKSQKMPDHHLVS